MRKTYDNRIAKVVWAIYYLMVAILVFIILQLFSFSSYYTGLISIAPSISYALPIIEKEEDEERKV